MFRRLKNKISDYRFEKRMAKQRYKRGYSDSDCWGMNYWLCETFPKMIINLRDMKHSAPELEFEEYYTLPENWKNKYKNQYEERCQKDNLLYEEDSIFEKWYVILSRIAYCLEQANESLEIYNKYKQDYHKAMWGTDLEEKHRTFKEIWNNYFEKVNGGYILKTKQIDPELEKNYFSEEDKINKYKEDMKNEAMDLLKKYFYNLWD